jgi:hypothetical protein
LFRLLSVIVTFFSEFQTDARFLKFNRIFRPYHTKLCLVTADGGYILVRKLQLILSCILQQEKSMLLINIDLLSRKTQYSNTAHLFIYFPTTCFCPSSRSSSGRNTTTHSERLVMVEFSDSQFLILWHCGPTRARAFPFFRFLDHKKRRATVGRTPLDE